MDCKRGGSSQRISVEEPSSPPTSPQPSFDHLSLTYPQEAKSGSEVSVSMVALNGVSIRDDATPSPIGMRLSVGGLPGTDEDDDYSASMAAIIHRRASTTKKPRGLGKRRTSSPLDLDRRRSSVFTTSSAESTAITVEGQEGITQDEIFENIRLHKEVLESVKQQPWEMRRKIKLVQQAKEYIRRHEGHLQERLAQSKSTKDFMTSVRFILSRWWQWLKREFGNFAVNLIPWELRIKEIESHFGSVVASYFTFLRWVFWINIVMSSIIVCLIIVPEVLAADRSKPGSRSRKEIQNYEQDVAYDLSTLWNFEGLLKYSPMFYGYYSDEKKTAEGYPLPLSYFITGLGIYVYSFVAILRRMAKNARQSKLSEKEDEYIFSWKVFTGWDYMIGNPETAFNRFASITMGFKEALLEEKEKKKDDRNWKVLSLRVLANLLILMLLASSAYAVVLVVARSKGIEEDTSAGWWRQNEITLVMSLITTVFPNLFEGVGMLEQYHPRKQLRWQLGRIMVLNFLNLYTLMFALFGKVNGMTIALKGLKPNATVLPFTISSDLTCHNVSVNCSLLQEFKYNQTIQQTTEILSFLTFTALMTKYEPNGTLSLTTPSNFGARKINETISGRFNPTQWWDLLHTIVPQLGRTTALAPDSTLFQAGITDSENLTMFTPHSGFGVDSLRFLPGNNTTLKVALPLLLKLVLALVPQRSFYLEPTTSSVPYNTTLSTSFTQNGLNPFLTSTLSSLETEIITETDFSSTTETIFTTTDIESTTDATPTARTRAWRKFPRLNGYKGRLRYNGTATTRLSPLWRTARELIETEPTASEGLELTDEVVSNNLILGRNGYPTGNAMSTRGDIPGDASGSEADFAPVATSPMTTTSTTVTTTTPIPDDADKLITTIVTMIDFIFNNNSSRTDFANLSTVHEYAKLVTNYHSHAETKMTRAPYNSSVNSTFQRNSTVVEAIKCFVIACENGTIDPPNFVEFLNCTTLDCAMQILRDPNVAVPPNCIIPGSRSCMITEPPPTVDPDTNKQLGKLCWETMFGQEMVKLTVMDLIFTVAFILVLDFIRAVFVRLLNPCWCWDLEKRFPQYGDFKIAENILHLVNNQGMIWMGLFFSPALPAINLVKLVMLMYIRSWTVMTCNVPHETVFRASRSNNFYFALLLFMLFLCVLPVGYAVVALPPSWHCGPFSTCTHIYNIFTSNLMNVLPEDMKPIVKYLASPGIIIPLLLLLVLIIYYLMSLTSSLREANNDLKIQLRRERTEERRKMFKIAGGRIEKETALSRWQAIIPIPTKSILPKMSVLTSGKQTGFAGLAKRATLKARELSQSMSQEKSRSQEEPAGMSEGGDEGSGTDVDISQASLPEDVIGQPRPASAAASHKIVKRKPSTTESTGSRTSEIPLIKISKDEDIARAAAAPQPSTSKVPLGPPMRQPAVEPAKRERIVKALISRAKGQGRTKTAVNKMNELAQQAGAGSPIGSMLNQEHLLEMEELSLDIHPLFFQFQSGFENQGTLD